MGWKSTAGSSNRIAARYKCNMIDSGARQVYTGYARYSFHMDYNAVIPELPYRSVSQSFYSLLGFRIDTNVRNFLFLPLEELNNVREGSTAN